MISHRRQIFEAAVTLGFLVLVALLLRHVLRGVNLDAVLDAASDVGAKSGGAALLSTFVAYSAVVTFEQMSAIHFQIGLPRRVVARTSFIAYAFNFNLGAAIGAWAMRFRLYQRLGLSRALVTKIVLACTLTCWSGYALVAGALFAISPPEIDEVSQPALRAFGVCGLALMIGYLLLCRLRRSPLSIRHLTFEIPTPNEALLQLCVSSVYWLAAATTLFLLFPAAHLVPFAKILGIYLFAAIAAVMAHLPAGLGILEGTCVLLLSPQVPREEVLASLLVFRVVFYFVPLVIAGTLYLILEIRHHHELALKKSQARSPSGLPPASAIPPSGLPPA